jgi:oligopeptide transport system substrate-binding protein
MRIVTGLAFLLGLILASGCSRRETPVQQGNRAKILHRAIEYDPAELDPHVVSGLAEAKVITALFDPLVQLDPQTLQPAPALADKWTVSADGITYTFHLRADAKWSNGEAITAHDCIAAWKRAMTPSLAADYAGLFHVIRGAEAFVRGTVTDFAQVGLAAPDPHTLVVTLARPAPYFLQLLSLPVFRPVLVSNIARQGDAYRRGGRWTRPENIVTSGPFTLKEWSPSRRLIVEKWSGYWDAARVRLQAIHFLPVDSEDAEERAFRSGQLHVTEHVPPSKVAAYRRDQPELLRIDPYLDTYFFRFNVRRTPLQDSRVRRALSLAIDRVALTQKLLTGGQQPAATLVPPGLPGYTPPNRPVFDLAEARRLLAEAGFPGGRGLPQLEILHINSASRRMVCEAIQEMWRRDLGLDVRLLNQEPKVMFAARRAGDYQIILSDWIGDYLDPTTFLDLWRNGSQNNHTGWSEPAYDELLRRAAESHDPTLRADALKAAEIMLLEAAPIAPIYYHTHVYLLQASVKGWHPNALDQIDYKEVWLE